MKRTYVEIEETSKRYNFRYGLSRNSAWMVQEFDGNQKLISTSGCKTKKAKLDLDTSSTQR